MQRRNLCFAALAILVNMASCADGRSLVTLDVRSDSLTGIDHLRVVVTNPSGMVSAPIDWPLPNGTIPPAVAIPLGFDRHATGSMSVAVTAFAATGVSLSTATNTISIKPSISTTLTINLPANGTAPDMSNGDLANADLTGTTDDLINATSDGGTTSLTPTPSSLNFGPVVVGQEKVNSIVFTNDGAAATGTLSVSLGGTDASLFQVRNNDCSTLASKGTCMISVAFVPAANGAAAASLIVTDANGPVTTVSLDGMGQATASVISIVPTTWDFTTIDVGDTGSKSFVVSNTGDATSGTVSASIVGVQKDQFAIDGATNTCTTLAPTKTCNFTIRFNPMVSGSIGATLQLVESPGGTINVPLSGTGGNLPVTVVVMGVDGATGKVSSAPTGITNCTSTCTTKVAPGTNLVLSVTPSVGSALQDFSSNCTSNGQTCSAFVSAPLTITVTFTPPNLAFVTDSSYTVAGLKSAGAGSITAGADAACNTAAGTPGGTDYFAWLSDSSLGTAGNANVRIGTASGWVRPDGLPFASSFDGLRFGYIQYPNEQLKNGTTIVATKGDVLTGTADLGYASNDCNGWASTANTMFASLGDLNSGTFGWTYGASAACNNLPSTARLYCLQKKYRAQIAPQPAVASARRIFISSVGYSQVTGGLGPAATAGSMDSICAGDATASGLPGTYKAMVATVGASAASRFSTLPTGKLIRPDNVVVLDNASQLFSATKLKAAITLFADGTTPFGGAVLSGASSLTDSGATVGNTCNSWADHNGTDSNFAALGNPKSTRSDFFSISDFYKCDNDWRFYCLQASD